MRISKVFQFLAMSVFLTVGGICIFVTDADAVSIRVSQESASGAGDFDANVVGFVTSFNTGLSASAFYSYSNPNNASYNGELNGGPLSLDTVSQLFLVDGVDGLSLFIVHDDSLGTTGGSAVTQFDLSGDTASIGVRDDGGENYVDTGTLFSASHNWIACCTDGYTIGALNGNWTMLGQFTSGPTGITSWQVTSADNNNQNLVLAAGRRVRLDTVAAPIPEPSTILLLGSGLVGLGFWRWKKAA